MRSVFIENNTHPFSSPIQVHFCESFYFRLRGFMFQKGVAQTGGLLIVQPAESRLDAAIHMFFVNFDLGVVWINHQNIVVDTCLARRWRPFYMPANKAKMILEIHPGRLTDFSTGDHLMIDHE